MKMKFKTLEQIENVIGKVSLTPPPPKKTARSVKQT
jgi:hypothetical protein